MKSRLLIITSLIVAIPAFAKLGDTLWENMKHYGWTVGLADYHGYPEYRFLWTDENHTQWGVAVVLKNNKTARIQYYKVPDFHQAIFRKNTGYELIGGTREATRFSDDEVKTFLEQEAPGGWKRSLDDTYFYQNELFNLIGSVRYNALMDFNNSPFEIWGLWSLSIETEDFFKETYKDAVIEQASRDSYALRDQYEKWEKQQNGK